MKAATLNTTHAPLQLGDAVRAWLDSSAQVLRIAAHAAWNGLYAITKARLLLEQGVRRPARRL